MKEVDEQFTPAEVCGRFDIPRTTLFRWEQLGEIPKPERGAKEERIYRREHLHAIAGILRKKIEDEIRSSLKHHPDAAFFPLELQERLYRTEFFGDKDPQDGLRQLQGLAVNQALSPDTVAALASNALSRPPRDRLRAKIWSVLALNDDVAA